MINGRIRWFHRNEKGETVFSAESSPNTIIPNKWVELAVTYSSDGLAKIYCDGVLIKEEKSDQMLLSQDWGAFAGSCQLSRHEIFAAACYFAIKIQFEQFCEHFFFPVY